MARDAEMGTRRAHSMKLSQQQESWNDVQTSNPASSLEGTPKASWGLPEPRYPGDSQQSSWSKGLTPRWGVCSLHRTPISLASWQSWRWGNPSIPPLLSQRGPLFHSPTLHMQIYKGVHSHMSEKTPRYTKPLMDTKHALHTQKHM